MERQSSGSASRIGGEGRPDRLVDEIAVPHAHDRQRPVGSDEEQRSVSGSVVAPVTGEGLDLEAGYALREATGSRRRQPGHMTVDSSQRRGMGLEVHQQREATVPWAGPESERVLTCLQPAVRRVSVMTVGDQGLSARQVGGQRIQRARVADGPQPVSQAVRSRRLRERRPSGDLFDDAGRRAGLAPEEQPDRLEVRLRRGHQPGSVLDQAHHDVLVREDCRRRYASPNAPTSPRWRTRASASACS